MSTNQSGAPADLLGRYLLSLDGAVLDDAWAASLFTGDARVEFPMSAHTGLAGMAAYHRDALGAFRATQHLAGAPVVDVLGADRVGLAANLLSTHVHHPSAPAAPGADLFVTGGLVTAEARRAPDVGWRLASLAVSVVWTTGAPPPARAEQ